MLKTYIMEDLYEKKSPLEELTESEDDGEEVFKDRTHGNFYPIRVQMDRIYLDMLYNYEYKEESLKINSISLGIDKIMVDDSYIGGAKKVMDYVNMKKFWNFNSEKKWYSYNGNRPVIVFEVQLAASG